MSRMTTVNRQNANTWANLHSRLRAIPFTYEELFPPQVGKYIKDSAVAVSSCQGYVFDCLVATTAYIISERSVINYNSQCIKPNMYFLFVGPPSTGKSQAIKIAAADPLQAIAAARNEPSLVIGKSTSAGLLHRLSERDGMLISSEVHDILHKMVKNDGENASGDIATLCHLFSGEKVASTYATQKSRDIEAGRAFYILGCTQPAPAAHLFTGLDVGNGMIERIIFHMPDCLRPKPSSTKRAREDLHDKPTLTHILQVIHQLHESQPTYTFDQECQDELDIIEEQYIDSINSAIVEGILPPQSKKVDLIVRMAAPIHVISSVTTQLLDKVEPVQQPTTRITKQSLDAAVKFIEYVEGQKETFLCELRDITCAGTTPEKVQPSEQNLAYAIVKTPGPVVTYRAFKTTCTKAMRSVSCMEYRKALDALKDVGEVVQIRLRGSKDSTVFVKHQADDIDWSDIKIIKKDEYRSVYIKKQPACITPNIRAALIETGKCTEEIFTN